MLSDILVSRYDEGGLSDRGWTYFVFVHSEGQFVPSGGVSSEFAGQQFSFFKWVAELP